MKFIINDDNSSVPIPVAVAGADRMGKARTKIYVEIFKACHFVN